MTGHDFAATRRRVLALHADGEYAAAMDVAGSAARDFPDHADQTSYCVACLVALQGQPQVALDAALHPAVRHAHRLLG